MIELEDAVEDAILTEHTDDPVLRLLLEIAIAEIAEARHLFDNIIDEPVFYKRYFIKWVTQSLQASAEAEKLIPTDA